jgi:hypothetical protein
MDDPGVNRHFEDIYRVLLRVMIGKRFERTILDRKIRDRRSKWDWLRKEAVGPFPSVRGLGAEQGAGLTTCLPHSGKHP